MDIAATRAALLEMLSPEQRTELDAITAEIKAGRFRDMPLDTGDAEFLALCEEEAKFPLQLAG